MYKYEALLLGGLPEEGLARAGLKVSSKVLISAAAQNEYMLKVSDQNGVQVTNTCYMQNHAAINGLVLNSSLWNLNSLSTVVFGQRIH